MFNRYTFFLTITTTTATTTKYYRYHHYCYYHDAPPPQSHRLRDNSPTFDIPADYPKPRGKHKTSLLCPVTVKISFSIMKMGEKIEEEEKEKKWTTRRFSYAKYRFPYGTPRRECRRRFMKYFSDFFFFFSLVNNGFFRCAENVRNAR